MKSLYALGLSALTLGGCATYRQTIVDKELVGQILNMSDSTVNIREISVLVKCSENDFVEKSYIDEEIRKSAHIGSTVTVQYRQLCKTKYKKGIAKDTTCGEGYIIDLKKREQRDNELTQFYNMDQDIYNPYKNGIYPSKEYLKFKHEFNKNAKMVKKALRRNK